MAGLEECNLISLFENPSAPPLLNSWCLDGSSSASPSFNLFLSRTTLFSLCPYFPPSSWTNNAKPAISPGEHIEFTGSTEVKSLFNFPNSMITFTFKVIFSPLFQIWSAHLLITEPTEEHLSTDSQPKNARPTISPRNKLSFSSRTEVRLSNVAALSLFKHFTNNMYFRAFLKWYDHFLSLSISQV